MQTESRETIEEIKARLAAQEAAKQARLAELRAEGEKREADKRKAAQEADAAKSADFDARREEALREQYKAEWLRTGGNLKDFADAWPELRAAHFKREVEREQAAADERVRRFARDF